MATFNNLHINSENLLQQLRSLKFIMGSNQDILDKNPVSNEFLNFKIDIAQNYIEELQLWEEIGNQGKCDSMVDNTLFFLEQARVLLDRMLDDHCNDAWLDFQKELRFTNYASINHKYVLT